MEALRCFGNARLMTIFLPWQTSVRIVGIQFNFPNKNLLFVLGLYLPSSNVKLEEFQEYFDHLWVLYDSRSAPRVCAKLG